MMIVGSSSGGYHDWETQLEHMARHLSTHLESLVSLVQQQIQRQNPRSIYDNNAAEHAIPEGKEDDDYDNEEDDDDMSDEEGKVSLSIRRVNSSKTRVPSLAAPTFSQLEPVIRRPSDGSALPSRSPRSPAQRKTGSRAPSTGNLGTSQPSQSRLSIASITQPPAHLASSISFSALSRRSSRAKSFRNLTLLGQQHLQDIGEEVAIIFIAINLLRGLAEEHSRVREALQRSCGIDLRGALGIFQTMCPRRVSAGLLHHKTHFARETEGASSPDRLRHSAQSPPSSPAKKERQSNTSDLAGALAEGWSSMLRFVSSPQKHAPNTDKKKAKKEKKAGPNGTAMEVVSESCVRDQFPYQPSPPEREGYFFHGQSASSFHTIGHGGASSGEAALADNLQQCFSETQWTLLVTARLQLEDLLQLVQIAVPASYTEVRPHTTRPSRDHDAEWADDNEEMHTTSHLADDGDVADAAEEVEVSFMRPAAFSH